MKTARTLALFTLFAFLFVTDSFAESRLYQAKYSIDQQGYKSIIYFGPSLQNIRLTDKFFEISYPQYIKEHQATNQADRIVELYSYDINFMKSLLAQRQLTTEFKSLVEEPQIADEVVTLVDNGPSANRIDLVFMGDGYTENEKQKFYDDMKRLVQDMFTQDTFASYLPLFNVHLVFRASQESGIGKGTPKNTAYRLYREGNTLRAISPGNPAALRSSCQQAPGCDYPVVIANDPYYGGLGGEFAVSTSSETSGTVVLRHELGHNFGRVGEEYDGGGYFGANYSSSLPNLKWQHWLTSEAIAQQAVARFIDWPWQNLDERAFTINFTSTSGWTRWLVEFSSSGTDKDESLAISLDNIKIPFQSTGIIDRDFYRIENPNSGFGPGQHQLVFQKGTEEGTQWLSNIGIYEFSADYNFSPQNINAYPLFSQSGTVQGYRSTHNSCLMRNMKHRYFCKICQENNWLNFFEKIALIDTVEVIKSKSNASVKVNTVKLGQLRQQGKISAEQLVVSWYHHDQLIEDLANQFEWKSPLENVEGAWKVRVELKTPEVRKDERNLLVEEKSFNI